MKDKDVIEGNRPVLLVFDTDKVLLHAGAQENFAWELLDEYISKGYTLTTITIDEYRAKNITVYQTKMFIDFSRLKPNSNSNHLTQNKKA